MVLAQRNLNKAERVAYIDAKLATLYPKPPIPLDHSDPFTLLIAVLLSAQCTDERVNQVTPGLFREADNPLAMAALDVDDIRTLIRPCGLSPQKSKAIKRLSHLLLAEHDGLVPQSFEALEQLPGLGIKLPVLLWHRHLAYPVFLWIPTYID